VPITPLLRDLDHAIEETVEEALRKRRLSGPQWKVLNVLAEATCTIGELNEVLAESLDPTGQKTTEVELEPLLGAGLVAEKAGLFHLSDAGRAECRSAREDIEGIWDRMVQGLDGDDYTHLVQTLEAMIDNLSR
jgi:hypothetical protein